MASRRRAGGALLAAAATIALQGCYETLPVQQGVAPVAERVQFTLNDQGRVGLAPKLGPGVDKVEGTVLQVEGDAYEVGVTGVVQIGGSRSLWNGERVNVRKEFVAGYAVRKLSRTRSWLLAGGVTGGMLAFILARDLLIGGGGVEAGSDDPGPASLRGIP